MSSGPSLRDLLGSCHGYAVLADDGWLGDIDTPVFGSASNEPDYLVVNMCRGQRQRVLVPVSLVHRVEENARLVQVRGGVEELSRLPNSVPLELHTMRHSQDRTTRQSQEGNPSR